jgi:Domain of unknown function (DUF6852)/Domain of unknown function (DUF5606)
MDYKKIVSVSGLPGLFELVSSKSDGAVVKSLEDQLTKFVSSRQHNFSHLESIEVYTKKDNAYLGDVFEAMKKSKEKLPEAKADNMMLKSYFEKVFPELDFDRVYYSDMKKMVKWFQILDKNKIEIKPVEETNEVQEEVHTSTKPAYQEAAHTKEGKPQKVVSKKIESRGVK